METITLENNIEVMYIEAASFPDGILAAYQKLHSKVPFSTERKYFGLSRPEGGEIIYKAAAEERQDNEAKELNLNTLTLKKGTYTCLTIKDYIKDLESISRTFKQLLSTPNLDPQGYCVEWYFNDTDVMCLIRLEEPEF